MERRYHSPQSREGCPGAGTDAGAGGPISAAHGYRRIGIFLGRDGHQMSFGRAYRLWKTAQLQVPRRRPRKRIASGRPRPQAPTGANQVWSCDFVFDGCANGQKLKCLTVSDEWTREGLAIEVDGRIRYGRVIEVLTRLVSERGPRRSICAPTTGRSSCRGRSSSGSSSTASTRR